MPINNWINTKYMRLMLSNFGYKDMLVCDLLEFGFPIGFTGDENSMTKIIFAYELKYNAIIGPFKTNHFTSNSLISPFNTEPKQTVDDRQIILGLSSCTSGAQRVTSAFLMWKLEKHLEAMFVYNTLGNLLEKCGIAPEILVEIMLLIKAWLSRDKATKREVKSLL
ncbi:hypothetical protein MAR_005513, partial [Mya arenaria]